MPLPDETESRYYAAQGFDADHARQVRTHYVQFVEGRSFLVELGCGRGEFLDVAADSVTRVLGVDSDPAMVEQVQARGHDAVCEDAAAWLRSTEERPDAIMLAHLVEHLDVEQAHDLFLAIDQVLAPGGALIVVTPNPACFANLANDFWSDPTHVRLYTLDLLSFLMDQTGFEVTERAGNPTNVPGAPPELAVSGVIGPWGAAEPTVAPPAPIQYDESFQLETLLDEASRLRDGVQSTAHWVTELSRRLEALRHQSEVLIERQDALLRRLWGPNEIYVVAERRA